MPFNIFAPHLLVCYNLNYSASFLEQARFCGERAAARRSKLTEKNGAKEDVGRADLSEEFRRVEAEKRGAKLSLLSFPADLKQMLRYNQNKPLQLALFLCHLLLLLVQIFKSHVYSSYSTQRDPKTQEFVDPVLRFVESKLFLFDAIHVFDRTGLCNRLVGLNFIQYLMLRLWCFRRLLKVAKVNRDRYKKLNIVDSYFCYLMNLRASTRDWLALFLRNSGGSKISSEDSLSLQVSSTSRNLAKLDNLDKLDRVYFYNQIVFTRSYLDTGIHLADIAEKTEKALRPRGALSEAFSLSLANKRHFHPQPAHPLHANHLAWLLQLYLVGSSIVWLAVFIVVAVFAYVGLHEANEDYIPLTDSRRLLERALKFRSVPLTFNLSLMASVFAVNFWDLSIMTAYIILCYSRSFRVTQLFDLQMRLHRAYLCRHKPHLNREPGFQTASVRLRHLEPNSRSPFNLPLEVQERNNMLQLFRKPVLDFNGQVSHLLDLVQVLLCEMRDLKAYFTPLLNLYLVIGTISFAAVFLITAKASSLMELFVACGLGSIVTWNLLFLLCAGAFFERVLRKIYLRLQWLMANEIGLLEVSVVRRMQLICEHLTQLENRSVVLLGNFSLNFGSLTSILGWIITGNLLIQRFVI